MSKEKAREILNDYVIAFGFPIKDAVVNTIGFDQFTFRYLLMIAYDLKDNKEDEAN